MILKALTLENFKGIREPVRIEFAPLTLLFGPNNAGKSTIVQALMYAREVLERNNCDAGRTELGGDVVDLGGFKNLVHAHDYRNRAIRMRFELDLSKVGLPDYTENIREHKLDSIVHSLRDSPTWHTEDIATELVKGDLWVEFEVAWRPKVEEPFVRSYQVGTGEATYAAVDCNSTSGNVELSYLNGGVAPFGTRDTHDILETSAPNDGTESDHSDESDTHKATRRDVIWKSKGWFIVLLKSLVKARMIPVQEYECETEYVGNVDRAMRLPSQFFAGNYYVDTPGPMPLLAADSNKPTALPEWGSRIRVRRDVWKDYEVFESDWNWEYPYFAQEFLSDVLTTLITGPGERLVEALQKSAYLSPSREVPSRQHTPVHSPGSNRWANGMAAWDWLMLDSARILRETNNWLGEGGLDTGYRIEVPRYQELEITGPLMAALNRDQPPSVPDWDWIRSELERLQERSRLQIRHLGSNTIIYPRDLGFGVSQVIPVIVAAVHHESGFVAIEEPESNVHPAFQVVLADLFIAQAKANPELLFLIETHSEHLMLRCLRRIRETAKDVLPDGLPTVAPHDVAVHFVESTKDGPRIKRIEIDEEGDFIDEWPGGFFEESFREKFAGR